MKKTFVRTQNVKNFISLINSLQNKPDGVPKMALVYGEPGLGKSRTVVNDPSAGNEYDSRRHSSKSNYPPLTIDSRVAYSEYDSRSRPPHPYTEPLATSSRAYDSYSEATLPSTSSSSRDSGKHGRRRHTLSKPIAQTVSDENRHSKRPELSTR